MFYGLNSPLQIAADAVFTSVTTGSEITIPNTASGAPARYVHVGLNSADASDCGIKPIQTGETPTIGQMMKVAPGGPGIVLNVAGFDALRAIAVSGTLSLTVTPLENQ